MGSASSKHEKDLKNIRRDVSSIRSSIRSTRSLKEENKHDLMNYIIKQTDEVNKLKRKVNKKKVNDTMVLIQDTTRELLRSESLKSNASSHQHVKIRPKSLIETSSANQSSLERMRTNSLPTLDEIEAKLNSLKPLIVTAIQNQDRKQLRLYKETIRLLVGDLEQIPLNKNENRKKLQTQLSACYQKIDKAFREISRNSNLEYLVGAEKKSILWKELNGIENDLKNVSMEIQRISTNSDGINIQDVRKSLSSIQPRLSSIEPLDDNIKLKRLQLVQRSKQLNANLESAQNDTNTLKKANKIEENKNIDKFVDNLKSIQNNIEEKTFSQDELTKISQVLDNLKKSVTAKRKSMGDFAEIVENEQQIQKNTDKDLNVAQEMRNIQSKMNFFKEKIDQYRGNKEIEEKIQHYIEKISSFIDYSNRNLANQAQIVLNDLNNILIELKTVQLNDESFNRIVEIRSLVENLLVKLDKNPKRDDLLILIEDLQQYKTELKNIIVPAQLPDYKQSQNATFDLINMNINFLNDKLTNLEQNYDIELRDEIEKLKKMVNRFNGTYRNILYNDIEKKLNHLLSNVIENVHNPAVSKAFMNDIQKLLKILEQRSTKRQSAELEFLTTQNHDGEDVAELTKIQEKFLKIKENFISNNIDSNTTYNHLNDEINQLLSILNNNSTNDELKIKLIDGMKLLQMDLNERVQQLDRIVQIENQLNEIEKSYYDNNSLITQSEKDDIDEELIAIQLQLGKLNANVHLKQKCNKCNERVTKLLRKLREISSESMIV